MKRVLAFGICIVFLMVMCQLAGAALQWPVGPWETAVIFTSDAVHQAEASAVQDGNMWTIKAGGDDIWGVADQFTFVYKEVSGDFDVSVTVHSLELTNDWSKAGIMARQDISPGSRNVAALCRGLDDLVTFQRREVADSDSASERCTPSGAPRPVTIRLTKTGNEFMGGWSLDGGATWEANVTRDGVTPTPVAVVDISDPYFVGIAVTSHAAGVITTAVVEVLGDVITAVRPDQKLSVTWGAIKASQ